MRLTYREMAAMADRIAVGLSRIGSVAMTSSPCNCRTWWQFTLTYLACSRIGAVINPLMHIFRERELSFMLQHGESKSLSSRKNSVVLTRTMITGLRPTLPALQHVIVVGGTGDNSFERLLSGPQWEEAGTPAKFSHAIGLSRTTSRS